VPGAPPPSAAVGSPGVDNQKSNRKRKGKKEGTASGGPTTPGEDGVEGRQSLDVGNGVQGAGYGQGQGRGNGAQGPRQDREQPREQHHQDGRGDGRGGGPVGDRNRNAKRVNGAGGIVNMPPPVVISPPVVVEADTPTTPGIDSALDPVAKKARNLNKKLKAIEELKEKAKRGERLEATQLRKMEGEAEIRKELISLGV